MASAPPPQLDTDSERKQTDESLRAERAKADDALADEGFALDDAADALIARARARADRVLAVARGRVDRGPSSRDEVARVAEARAREDALLVAERASADATVRAERVQHVAMLSVERGETDKDLWAERARADDALATRDEFLGIVSHDLRNMVVVVTGFAELIEDAVSQPDRLALAKGHAQRIRRAGGRMSRLIGDLVDVASIHAGELTVTRETADACMVVTESVESFQPQALAASISLTATLPSDLPLLSFDPPRVLQVLANLISNALKFTPRGGEVVVSLTAVDEGVRVGVRDTGKGIPPEQLELVFHRYVQVTEDRRGIGLGLYISKCIVQGHGGRIWAESVVGAGSTFFFLLPASAGAAT